MTAFFKWISSAHAAITKQKYVAPPECETGKCSATFQGPESQVYVVDWAKKDQQAQMFQSSFGPVKVACGDISGQQVRTWNYASARKVLCKENGGASALIEMYGGAVPTTKLIVYTDRYLTLDPDFAAVVQSEGKER